MMPPPWNCSGCEQSLFLPDVTTGTQSKEFHLGFIESLGAFDISLLIFLIHLRMLGLSLIHFKEKLQPNKKVQILSKCTMGHD